MSNNFISIKNGAGKSEHSDRRCKRKDCIFPGPTVRFDFGRHRVVAVWSWTGVGVLDAPNGVKIKIVPTLRLVPISYN